VPLGRHAAAEALGVEGPVLPLDEVRVDRLVGEEQAKGRLRRRATNATARSFSRSVV
jgi:hypothetical protein